MIKVRFEKISVDGVAVGFYNNHEVYAFSVFPGEVVYGDIITKKKRRYLIPKIVENPHPSRIEPKDKSYLSTSTWQVASYEWQVEQKKKILQELYHDHEIDEFVSPLKIWGYRNKVEFSFSNDGEKVSLAFFDRLKKGEKILVDKFSLVDSEVSRIANDVCCWINRNKIPHDALKSLILRQSKTDGRVIGLLLFTHIEKIPIDCSSIANIRGLSGIMVAYSDPRSPVSNVDQVFFRYGNLELKETIGKFEFIYPIDGFFQNNLELFPYVISRMNELIETDVLLRKVKTLNPEIESLSLLDKLSKNVKLKALELYCGIGTIGICLAGPNLQIIGVDISESNVNYAYRNIKKNEVDNYSVVLSPSEKINETYYEDLDLLIVDPPRAGLHPRVIKNILRYKPNWIMYLSCNPITQLNDLQKLFEFYSIEFLGGYDFYPQTPHLESLILLKNK